MSTSDVGKKKKQDPLGGTYVSPVTWANKKKKKKKQDPLGGTFVSPRDVGKKTRPTRGDLCLTQRRGQKTKPMWGRRDSMSPLVRDKQYPVPSHWVREEGLIDVPPPLRGTWKLIPCPPDKKGGAYCCPSLQSPPVKGRHRSSSHVPLGSSPHALPQSGAT